jgi:CubicO group peptidase (beta-lactamase class C family)
MKTLRSMVVAIAFAGCASTPGDVVTVGDPHDPRFSAVLDDVKNDMETNGVPGGALAVLIDGQLAFAAGIGVEREGEDAPVVPTTLFRVASLSKMVLASTAMKLVEDGTLDLSNPVTTYVPLTLGSGYDPSSIEVSQLLDHTSGIPDFPVETICPTGYGQLPAYFAAHSSQPLWSPADEVWNYSNQGYSVAGWIVEAISGQPFEDEVAAHVFGPAGMATATYDPATAMKMDHAVGHSVRSGTTTFIEPDAYDCEATRPPGGVIASVIDYAHLAETVLASGGTMLTPGSVAAMETAHANTDYYPGALEQYGYAFFVLDGDPDLGIIYHDGDDTGFHATFWLVPSRGIGLILFYNSDVARSDDGAKAALQDLLGSNALPTDSSTPPSTWTKYAGTYLDPNVLGTIDVTLEGTDLNVEAPDLGVSGPLRQLAGDRFEFSLNGDSTDVVFYPGGNGAPQWFVTSIGVAERQ